MILVLCCVVYVLYFSVIDALVFYVFFFKSVFFIGFGLFWISIFLSHKIYNFNPVRQIFAPIPRCVRLDFEKSSIILYAYEINLMFPD